MPDELACGRSASVQRREGPDVVLRRRNGERGRSRRALAGLAEEGGGLLSDDEVRDELLTMLLAGHETTATALAWAFDLLLHTPAALERARGGTFRALSTKPSTIRIAPYKTSAR